MFQIHKTHNKFNKKYYWTLDLLLDYLWVEISMNSNQLNSKEMNSDTLFHYQRHHNFVFVSFDLTEDTGRQRPRGTNMDPTTSHLCGQSKNLNTLQAEIFTSLKPAPDTGVELALLSR